MAYRLLLIALTVLFTAVILMGAWTIDQRPWLWSGAAVLNLLILFALMWEPSRLSKAVHKANTALENSEQRYRLLFEQNAGLIGIHQLDGTILSINPAAAKALGYTPSEMRDRPLDEFLHPSVRSLFTDYLTNISTKGCDSGLMRMITKAGKSRIWRYKNVLQRDENNKPYVIGHAQDVTDQHRVENSLKESEQRFKDFAELAADWFWETGPDLRLTYLSLRDGETLVGKPAAEMRGRTRRELLAESLHMNDRVKMNQHFEDLEAHRPFDFEYRSSRKDGREIFIRSFGKPIFDNKGKFRGYRGIGRDVTAERKLAQKISYQAKHDVLTGLVNRREFQARLEAALLSATRGEHQHVLCYIDLDQFKLVNDNVGHIAGDELLKQVTGLFMGEIRSEDTLARIGGDEFGLLLENCDVEMATAITESLLNQLRGYRFTWEDSAFDVHATIGVVPINKHSENVVQILADADIACYTAKDLGGNRIHIRQPNLNDSEYPAILRAADWLKAFHQNRFLLYTQPIVPLRSTQSCPEWYEFLIRMVDNNGDVVSPMSFIPAAERYGYMADIDRWVIDSVFKRYHEVFNGRTVRVSLNLSANSLDDGDLNCFVEQKFCEYDIPANAICFEITETAAIRNLTEAQNFMGEMRRRGCMFALDDFGTGLCSFTYLKYLTVDFLKIDHSFVWDLPNDRTDLGMVQAINQVSHTLGIETIAEGVETKMVVKQLRDLGVNYAQGRILGDVVSVENLVSTRQANASG